MRGFRFHRWSFISAVLCLCLSAVVAQQAATVVVTGENRIAVGCSTQLSASLFPAYSQSRFTWSSSDPSIASVSSTGMVTGLRPGWVVIIVKDQAGHQGSRAVAVEIGTPVIIGFGKETINICDPGSQNYRVEVYTLGCATVGTFQWDITSGSDKAHIVGSKTGSSVRVVAKKPSDSIGDVTLRVDHTLMGVTKKATLALTIARPKTATHGVQQFQFVQSGILASFGVLPFYCILTDQFDRPMKGVAVTEKIDILKNQSTPSSGYVQDSITGSDVTDERGRYTDQWFIIVREFVDGSAHIEIDQTVKVCDYHATHRISLRQSGPQDGYPLTFVKNSGQP